MLSTLKLSGTCCNFIQRGLIFSFKFFKTLRSYFYEITLNVNSIKAIILKNLSKFFHNLFWGISRMEFLTSLGNISNEWTSHYFYIFISCPGNIYRLKVNYKYRMKYGRPPIFHVDLVFLWLILNIFTPFSIANIEKVEIYWVLWPFHV